MQTSYGFSGLLCFSKTNTNSHSHSAPALYLTTRAEARVGGNSCRQSFRATRTSSWMLTGIVKCFKAHPMPTQTTKACQNMPPQCSCLSMHKTVKVCEKLSSRKSFLKKVRKSTVAREPKGKQKESYFSQPDATKLLFGRSTLFACKKRATCLVALLSSVACALLKVGTCNGLSYFFRCRQAPPGGW